MNVKNKHGGKGSRWVTVPNCFPEPDELTSEDWYHMFEGYCIGEYETKKSGKYYKKVRTMYCDTIDNLLLFLDYRDWHKKLKIRRSVLGRFFIGTWVRKKD